MINIKVNDNNLNVDSKLDNKKLNLNSDLENDQINIDFKLSEDISKQDVSLVETSGVSKTYVDTKDNEVKSYSTDYNNQVNKPLLNDVVLVGNKTSNDIGINEVLNLDILALFK